MHTPGTSPFMGLFRGIRYCSGSLRTLKWMWFYAASWLGTHGVSLVDVVLE